MSDPRRDPRPPAAAALATAGLLLAACGGGPRPPAAPPPQTPSVGTAEAAAPPPAETEPAPAAPSTTRGPAAPKVPEIVIEPAEGGPEEEPTLAEAARRERERRLGAGKPMVVINDANLEDHAVGQLTFMEDETPDPAAAGEAAQDGPDEAYWRDRVRGIRERWAEAAGRVPTLEERVAELRRRFYEADDAYYRDTRIKPAWDRAIDQIAQSRAEADAHKAELEKALAEGRLAGALPGWLREGIELEPEPIEPESPTYEPGEPQIVDPVEAGG